MKNQEIDLIDLGRKIWVKRVLVYKTMAVFLLVGFVIAYSIPPQYKVDVVLSPESGQMSGGGNNFSGMASMLGIGALGNTSQDALNSSMFPDLIKSTPFILEMYNINVTSRDGKEMTLSEYIKTQKRPWWGYILAFPGRAIGVMKSFFRSENQNTDSIAINPFQLTGEQSGNIAVIRNAITAVVDNKTNMTVLSVTFQDPVVTAIVADSAVMKLQKYIIDYRTKKAQADCDYLEKLCKQRKDEYLKTQRDYADFMDMNRNVVMQRAQVEGIRLQNDMSIAFQVYSQVETQLQVARAKVQEAKPVFAIVEPATVPLHPAGPNKMLIIVGCLFLAFAGSSAWILFKKQ